MPETSNLQPRTLHIEDRQPAPRRAPVNGPEPTAVTAGGPAAPGCLGGRAYARAVPEPNTTRGPCGLPGSSGGRAYARALPAPPRSTVHSPWSIVLVLLLWVSGNAAAGPRLEVKPAAVDFGSQAKNAGSYDFTFTLKNTGDAPLLISGVRTGCSCTTVTLAAQELAPGATTELRGQLLTKNYEGLLDKIIMLESNDSTEPRQGLPVKVLLPYKQPGVHFWPRSANVYASMQGEVGLQGNFWLENCDPRGKTKITKIVLPKGWRCDTSLPVTLQAGERKAFTISLPKPAADVFREGAIVVHTDNAASRKVEGSLVTTRPAR